jgi:hypothetical protein
MQFFIVAAGTGDLSVPPALETAVPCNRGECQLVAAPALFADIGSKAELQIGAPGESGVLFINARAQPSGDLIASSVEVTQQHEDNVKSLEFQSSVVPGQVVHLGTLNDRSGPGPEVFAVFEVGSTESVIERLKRWHPAK